MVQPGRSKALYGIHMRNLGFELEMSDILTKDAAQIVYSDLSIWEDRWGGYEKPNLDYSKWHIQSDGTLLNTNGTQCMSTYMDETGAIQSASNSKNSPHRMFWQGAELISPVIHDEDLDSRLKEASGYFTQFLDQGAKFSSKLNNSLHIHVDVSDLSPEVVLNFLWRIHDVQNHLNRLGNKWNGRKLFALEEVANITGGGVEHFEENYLTIKNRKVRFSANNVRRIVDIGPKFNPNKPDTIEFRCFQSLPSAIYIKECMEFCNWLIEQWLNPDVDYDLIFNEKFNKLESLMKFTKSVFVNRPGQIE